PWRRSPLPGAAGDDPGHAPPRRAPRRLGEGGCPRPAGDAGPLDRPIDRRGVGGRGPLVDRPSGAAEVLRGGARGGEGRRRVPRYGLGTVVQSAGIVLERGCATWRAGLYCPAGAGDRGRRALLG